MTHRVPTVGAAVEQESPWPFVIQAKVVSVPAKVARIAVGLLVLQCVLLTYMLWRQCAADSVRSEIRDALAIQRQEDGK